jgi:CRP-like cAMP-binding protein
VNLTRQQHISHASSLQSALFDGLSDEVAALLTAAAFSRHAAPGTILFHQGDAPEHLIQVVSGLVRMTQVNLDGAQTTLRLMGPGEIIGCVAVFKQFPYPATATALEDVVLISWRSSQILELMREHRGITENMLRIVGARASEMVQRIVEMSGKRVEQRIASALLRLADQAGSKADDGIRIEFPVTRTDLAEMVGVTYFTVSRTLSKWQEQGLVKNGRQRITILASHQLARLAENQDS